MFWMSGRLGDAVKLPCQPRRLLHNSRADLKRWTVHRGGTQRTTRASAAAAFLLRCPRPAAMDLEARHQACKEFHVKLRRRDTGVNLDAFVCARLLGNTFERVSGGEQVTLQSNPGPFYMGLGEAIAHQKLALVLPNHPKVAWWCCREAAEVHTHRGRAPGGHAQTCPLLLQRCGREARPCAGCCLASEGCGPAWEMPPPKAPSAVSCWTVTRALGSRRTRREGSNSYARLSSRAKV